MKFNNGSIIEPIESVNNNIRSRRGQQYYSRQKYFNNDDIKIYTLSDLIGRTLRVDEYVEEGKIIIFARDLNTSELFVLEEV